MQYAFLYPLILWHIKLLTTYIRLSSLICTIISTCLITRTVAQGSAYPPSKHIRPPHYPAGCPKARGNEEPFALIEDRKLGNRYHKFCGAVGGSCESTKECHDLNSPVCEGMFHAQLITNCIEGLCRQAEQKKAGSACSCVRGCASRNFYTGVEMRCVTTKDSPLKGVCVQDPCAGCGEIAGNKRCCEGILDSGPGITKDNARCICEGSGGPDCALTHNCKANQQCCGKNTRQAGHCCSFDSCNKRHCDQA